MPKLSAMRHPILFPLLLCFLGLWSACERTVDLEALYGDEGAQLVVLSNFTNAQTLVVFVSKSRSVFSQDPFEYVGDATVEVFSEGILLERLRFVPLDDGKGIPPHYESVKLKPEVGVVYTICVKVDGFDPVVAQSSVPEAIPIRNVRFFNLQKTENGSEVHLNFNFEVQFDDPGDVENFYHLAVYHELNGYSINPAGDTLIDQTIYNSTLGVFPNETNIALNRYVDGRSFLFKDLTFDGQGVAVPFLANLSYDKSRYLPGRFLVELRNVSKDYYLYHSTLSMQDKAASGEDPLNEGFVLFNNVENGWGVFAGYNFTLNFFDLQD